MADDMEFFSRDEKGPVRSAEVTRLGTPPIPGRSAAPNPVHYALWLEYCAGRNAALNREVDLLLLRPGSLNDECMQALYRQYVLPTDTDTGSKIDVRLRQLIDRAADAEFPANDPVDNDHRNLQQCVVGLGPCADTGNHAKRDDGAWTVESGAERMGDDFAGALSAAAAARDQSRPANDAWKRNELFSHSLRVCDHEAFEAILADQLLHPSSDDAPLSLLRLRIDNFTRFREVFGPSVNDQVVHLTLRVLDESVGEGDFVATLAPSEFGVLLLNATMADARATAEEIRAKVRWIHLRGSHGAALDRLSVSAGVGTALKGEPPERLMERVDMALRGATAAGGDQVEVSSLAK